MPAHGDKVSELSIGAVRVVVRYSCVRRDMYELSAPAPLPDALRASLAARGSLRGSDALYVVDVPETHQITVSSRTGRVVIMPRLTTERDAQRARAVEVAELVDSFAPRPSSAG